MKKAKIVPVETPQPKPEEVTVAPEVVPAEAPKVSKQPKVTKVGAMLREVRLQKDLKLSDVSKQLCIRKHYLESIEDSAYNDIPAFPYGIGFIRSYAKFLGLNSENIVDLYKEETHISEPVNMHVLEPQSEANMPNIQYIIISVAAIVVLCISWLIYNRVSSPSEKTSVEYSDSPNNGGVIVVEEFNADQLEPVNAASDHFSSDAESLVTVTDEPYVGPEVKDAKVEEPVTKIVKEEAPKESLVIPAKGIFIEVVEETWVEVKDDTRLYLSKVLQPGDSYTVPEGDGMILSVGKPDSVKVFVNGVETPVVRPNKKMNIALDDFLNSNH